MSIRDAIARALYAADCGDEDEALAFEDQLEAAQRRYLRYADAAISKMPVAENEAHEAYLHAIYAAVESEIIQLAFGQYQRLQMVGYVCDQPPKIYRPILARIAVIMNNR